MVSFWVCFVIFIVKFLFCFFRLVLYFVVLWVLMCVKINILISNKVFVIVVIVKVNFVLFLIFKSLENNFILKLSFCIWILLMVVCIFLYKLCFLFVSNNWWVFIFLLVNVRFVVLVIIVILLLIK